MDAPSRMNTRTTILVVLAIASVAGFVCCLGGAVLLPPAIQAVRETMRRQQTSDNLRQINEALRNYQQRTGNADLGTETQKIAVTVSSEADTPLAERMEAAKQRIVEQARQRGLARVADQLASLLTPSIRLKTEFKATCKGNVSMSPTASLWVAGAMSAIPSERSWTKASRIGNCCSNLTRTRVWPRCGEMLGESTFGFGTRISRTATSPRHC